jgi:hypothetical protein
VIEWTAITLDADTGASPITSYNLYWDAGTSGVTWTSLKGEATENTSLTYTVSSGLTSGTDYQFQLRAKNIYGFGPFTAASTITASGVPD